MKVRRWMSEGNRGLPAYPPPDPPPWIPAFAGKTKGGPVRRGGRHTQHRRAGPLSGTHGGAAVESMSATGRMDVRACPPPHPTVDTGFRRQDEWRAGKTRGEAHTTSSCRTPIRYPWWGRGGEHVGHGADGCTCVPTSRPHRGYRPRIGVRDDDLTPVRRGVAAWLVFTVLVHAGCHPRDRL